MGNNFISSKIFKVINTTTKYQMKSENHPSDEVLPLWKETEPPLEKSHPQSKVITSNNKCAMDSTQSNVSKVIERRSVPNDKLSATKKRKSTEGPHSQPKKRKAWTTGDFLKVLDDCLSLPRPIVKEEPPENSTLRRSSRLRIPRLKYWEKVVYDDNGTPTVVKRKSHPPISAVFVSSSRELSNNKVPAKKRKIKRTVKKGHSVSPGTSSESSQPVVKKSPRKGKRFLYSPESYLAEFSRNIVN